MCSQVLSTWTSDDPILVMEMDEIAFKPNRSSYHVSFHDDERRTQGVTIQDDPSSLASGHGASLIEDFADKMDQANVRRDEMRFSDWVLQPGELEEVSMYKYRAKNEDRWNEGVEMLTPQSLSGSLSSAGEKSGRFVVIKSSEAAELNDNGRVKSIDMMFNSPFRLCFMIP